MNESVRNQAALITGSAKRLGKEMASALAKRGFDLVIHYSNSANEAVYLANSLSSLGIKAVTLKANLLEHEETIDLIAHAKEALGKPLNLLINNASIFTNDS
ncbi:MAG: SDR family NAD(P)-dependent oxidoreductase, partial [Rhodobacteraceae bacterium]|nr:SDR family NAD(P)-dependent oxidoreductase [Paracoccaceae bacterium]